MSGLCKWVHEQLRELPLIKFPLVLERLPENGIYFFYEEGETWGHGGDDPRIVRIGTHRDGNFRSRIAEHYLLNESKMIFDAAKPSPHDRSIFRKHVGRALLNRDKDGYLQIWNRDFMKRQEREEYGHLRDIQKEKGIESRSTKLLRESFGFRFILIDKQEERIGASGFEKRLIGTVAQCALCEPSPNWLGKNSPDRRIRESGLWQIQHLKARPLDDAAKETISLAIRRTQEWIKLR